MLVAIDALDEDGLSVDEQLPALDLDLPEPESRALELGRLPLAVLQDENDPVEVGGFGGPLERVRDAGGHQDEALAPGRDVGTRAGGDGVGGGRPAVRAEQPGFDGEIFGGGRTEVLQPSLDPEDGVAVVRVQLGPELEVADVDGRRRKKIDVPEDAAQPPEVLAFEVGPVGISVDLDGQNVPAGPEEAGDVEFGRGPAVLAVPRELAVDPDIEGGVDAVKMEKDLPAGPRAGHGEFAPVRAHRIAVVRDPRRVGRKRIVLVEVDGHIVALELPVAGNADVLPAAGVEVGPVKIAGPIGRLGDPMEFPLPVESQAVSGAEALPLDGLGFAAVGHQGGVGRFGVPGQDQRVFPILDGFRRSARPLREKQGGGKRRRRGHAGQDPAGFMTQGYQGHRSLL